MWFATPQSYPIENVRRSSKPSLVQHYPKLPQFFNSNSDSKMMVCSTRSISSSPTVPRIASISRKKLAKKTIPLAQHSSSFVATQFELPVVDITCDYDSCRYNSFEESLRKRYGANYPPGNVVLNYIQLNTADSRSGIDRNASSHLLDPFEENHDSSTYSSVSTKLEAEYLSLLDHFIWKQRGKVLTMNKFTEIPSSDDGNLEASSHVGASSQSSP
jgi:hypothetical protein